MVTDRATEIYRARETARRDVKRMVAAESDRIGHLGARLATLGPAATLARGYAVVQWIDGAASASVLRSVTDAPAGTALRIRLSDGAVGAASTGPEDGTP
jgi:exodeoxyribonuclease VII large subunit